MLNMNQRAKPPAPLIPIMRRQGITVEDIAFVINRPLREAALIVHGDLTPCASDRCMIAAYLDVPEDQIFRSKNKPK